MLLIARLLPLGNKVAFSHHLFLNIPQFTGSAKQENSLSRPVDGPKPLWR
jgi:hypothetical protein